MVALLPLLGDLRAVAADSLDAPLELRLAWAPDDEGPVALRDDVTRAVLDALATRGCFSDVRSGSSAAGRDLRLDVLLSELREEAIHDDSLAERAGPFRPDQASRVTGLFSVLVRWELRTAATPIAGRKFRVERRHRPLLAGEDPARAARAEAVDALGSEVARAVCAIRPKRIRSALDAVAR